MTELVTKKKKKINFELLRKLEDAYDEAEEDLRNKEEVLIKSVHQEYLKAENKGEFFEKLSKSESWYYAKFQEYNLPTSSPELGERHSITHAERKVDDFVSSIDDETLVEEIRSKPAVEIVKTVNFGKYQETVSKIRRMRLTMLSEHDFNVDPSYKLVLLKELDETIDFLTELRKKVEVTEHERA